MHMCVHAHPYCVCICTHGHIVRVCIARMCACVLGVGDPGGAPSSRSLEMLSESLLPAHHPPALENKALSS